MGRIGSIICTQIDETGVSNRFGHAGITAEHRARLGGTGLRKRCSNGDVLSDGHELSEFGLPYGAHHDGSRMLSELLQSATSDNGQSERGDGEAGSGEGAVARRTDLFFTGHGSSKLPPGSSGPGGEFTATLRSASSFPDLNTPDVPIAEAHRAVRLCAGTHAVQRQGDSK